MSDLANTIGVTVLVIAILLLLLAACAYNRRRRLSKSNYTLDTKLDTIDTLTPLPPSRAASWRRRQDCDAEKASCAASLATHESDTEDPYRPPSTGTFGPAAVAHPDPVHRSDVRTPSPYKPRGGFYRASSIESLWSLTSFSLESAPLPPPREPLG